MDKIYYKLSASVMCADLLNLRHELELMERDGVDMLHIDVMDGNFVPNITLGFDTIRRIKAATGLPLDVHLMVSNNDDIAGEIMKIGCDRISFHISDGQFAVRLLDKIREAGIMAGIALTPSASERPLYYLRDFIDFALIMTVEPGFAGQRFIPSQLEKIRVAREILGDCKSVIADGNISVPNAIACLDEGADILVAGTSLFFDKNGYIEGRAVQARDEIGL